MAELKEGDIVSIDTVTILNGFYGDAAITYPVGEVDAETKKLAKSKKKALRETVPEELEKGKKLREELSKGDLVLSIGAKEIQNIAAAASEVFNEPENVSVISFVPVFSCNLTVAPPVVISIMPSISTGLLSVALIGNVINFFIL